MTRGAHAISSQSSGEPSSGSLWGLVAPPAIWLGHFLLSYTTVAIWCAKLAGADRSLGAARLLVGGYSLLALVGLAIVAWRAFNDCRHSDGGGQATIPGPPHELAGPNDRRRFLGRVVLLLAGLSAVAVVYAALVVIVLRSCT